MRASEMAIGLAAVMLAGLASTGFAQQIILSTDRHSYQLHEPIELRIDYVNRAEKPWALELEPVSLSVLEPGGPQRSVGLWQNRRDDVIDRSPLRKLVGPGQTYRRVVWVALDKSGDWIFPSVGRWQLGVQGLSAAQIEIEVVEPAIGDSKDAAALFDTGACRAFLSDGQDLGDAVPVLQEIVEKCPRTTFAFFAAWTLVQDRWVHRYEKSMDWEKERAWLSLILQAPQDHPLRPAAMYAMVRHHNFQRGHKDQAEKSAEDLAEAYPWSTWAHDVKSQFGHDVSAKLAPFSDDPAIKSRHEVTEPAQAAQPGDKPAAVPPDGGRASPIPVSTSAPADILDSLVPPQWKPKKAGTASFREVPPDANQDVAQFLCRYIQMVATGELRAAFTMLADDYVGDRGDGRATLARWRWFADRHELPAMTITFQSIRRVRQCERPATSFAAAKQWTEPLWLVVADLVLEPTATNNGSQSQVTLVVRQQENHLAVVSETYQTTATDLERPVILLFNSLREKPATTEIVFGGQPKVLPDLLKDRLGLDGTKDPLHVSIDGWRRESSGGRDGAMIFGRARNMKGDEWEFGLIFRKNEQGISLEEIKLPKNGEGTRAQ